MYRPTRRGRPERRSEPWDTHNGGSRKNPIGPDGRRRQCNVCDSIWHFFRDCPELEKVRKEYRGRNKKYDDDSHEQEVNLSF